MNKRILKNMEWEVAIYAIALSIIGIIALFSATASTEYDEFQKQIVWLCVGIVAMIVAMIVDYDIIVKFSPILYAISIILLIVVLFTKSINGASSWFKIGDFALQPGEISKVFVILFLSFVVSKIQESRKEEINNFFKLMLVLLVMGIPVALIIKQPDYGTAAAFLFATAGILFVSGINKRYIICTLLIIIIGVPLVYKFVLPDHAKTRIDVFLNPESDPKGSGYNVIQSKIAIGSGELTGMGLLKGNQTQLGYLYPKTTDFIFAVIGEEMGFVIAALVIFLNILLITKSIYIAKTAKDNVGSYIAMGITGIFLFHMLENIGMTMGLLPITGVPLLFISYGGSSMITSFLCIGLLLNISGRRQKAIFVK